MKIPTLGKFVLCAGLIGMCSMAPIYAEDVTTNKAETNSNLTEEQIKQKEDLNSMIEECLKDIQDSLTQIDSKIDDTKTKEEYKTYPAIRLNIDTPMFGLTSIVDQRLKVTKEVSTADVASGYSIRDIVKNNSLKLPSLTVASVVVMTRDVSLNKEEITIPDASSAVLKLMQYIDQTDNVNKFVDTQINKNFSGYIPKERLSKIEDIKSRLNKVNESLLNQDTKLTKMDLLHQDKEKYDTYISEYFEIGKSIFELKKNVKNILVTDEELVEIEKSTLALESRMLDFSKKVEDTYQEQENNINVESLLLNTKSEMEARRDDVKAYIDHSTIKKEVDEEKTEQEQNPQENKTPEEQNGGEEQKEENQTEVAVEEIKQYDVTSKTILDYMNTTIGSIEDKIKKYVTVEHPITPDEANSQEINQEVVNKAEVTNVVVTELTEEEKKNLLEEVNKAYDQFIIKENKFYLDNLNYILKDTTMKISDVSKYTDENVLQDMKYIYLELPDNLEQALMMTNAKSIMDTEKLTNDIKAELQKVVKANMSVTKPYHDMVIKGIKETSRN